LCGAHKNGQIDKVVMLINLSMRVKDLVCMTKIARVRNDFDTDLR